MSTDDDIATKRSTDTDPSATDAAYQLLVFSGQELRTFDLPAAGKVTIGRDDGNALRIDDVSVSRQHAVLRVGRTLEIEDLGGANGIFVRARPDAGPGRDTLHLNVRQLVRRAADIAVGDSILIGSTSIVVRHAPKVEIPDLEVPAIMKGDVRGGVVVVVLDPAMRDLYEQAARAARAQISILLLGETGVGKEVLARAIHKHSPRSKGPFMGINCAALSESLLESDLFGSEKGAFTGAVQPRAGLFEAANGGTVFLDEVGELSLGTQAKLLRVLEEREVTRLGSTHARPVDVRFVAATNRDIEADDRGARFRRDLYFRLAGISLLIPPLRERPREIESLVSAFVATACRQIDRTTPLAISPAAMDLLRGHFWPGNVRELRNVMERATVLCGGDTILPQHLPPALLKRAQPPAPLAAGPITDLQGEIKALERARIVEVLERCGGNQSQAAKELGMSRGTLLSRLAEFGLNRVRKRSEDPGA